MSDQLSDDLRALAEIVDQGDPILWSAVRDRFRQAADRIDAQEAMHDPEHWVSDTDHGAICGEMQDTIARLEAENERLRRDLMFERARLAEIDSDRSDNAAIWPEGEWGGEGSIDDQG